jgi:hypothetical protein
MFTWLALQAMSLASIVAMRTSCTMLRAVTKTLGSSIVRAQVSLERLHDYDHHNQVPNVRICWQR